MAAPVRGNFTKKQGTGATASIDTTGANALTVTFFSGIGSTPSISSDTYGNTWVLQGDYNDGGERLRIYTAYPATTGSGHTVTPAGTDGACITHFVAYSGATGFELPNGGDDTGSPFTASTSGSITVADSVIFSAGIAGTGATPNVHTCTPATMFSEEQDYGTYWAGAVADETVSTTGTKTHTWSVSSSPAATHYLIGIIAINGTTDGGSSAGQRIGMRGPRFRKVDGPTWRRVGVDSAAGVIEQTTATSADGVATVSAVGSSIAAATGTAAGAATVSGVGSSGAQTAATAAAGVATVSATAQSTAATTGTAAGVATVSAVGSSAAQAVATAAAGVAAVSSVGSSNAQTVATPASGTATVSGVGSTVTAGETTAIPADGVATVSAVGSSIAATNAVPASGTSEVSATTPSNGVGGGQSNQKKKQKKLVERAVAQANAQILAEMQAQTVAQAATVQTLQNDDDEEEILMLLL